MYEKIVMNLVGKVRQETLEGRKYTVAPCVMLTEGVHNGSQGALFYKRKELAKLPVTWNHKPVVVYHPEMNGVAVSACHPVIMESRKVGYILNSVFDDKLRSETWIENEKADKVDKRILEALNKGEMMEVSTGLFTDNIPCHGVFNGKEYEYEATNLRPDHLALLPDKKGACSIEDGGGLLQTNAVIEDDKWQLTYNKYYSGKARDKMPKEDFGDPSREAYPVHDQQDLDNAAHLIGHASDPEAVKARLKAIAKRKGLKVPDSWKDSSKQTRNETMELKDFYLKLQADAMARASTDKRSISIKNLDGTTEIVANVLSHADVHKGINVAMGAQSDSGYWAGHVTDVYDDFFVFQDGSGNHFKQKYSIDSNSNVSPNGESEPVVKHSEYRDTKGNHIAPTDKDMSGSGKGATPEPQSPQLKGGGNRQELPGGKSAIGGQGNDVPSRAFSFNTATAGVTNMTIDEYTNNAPPEIQEMLREGLALRIAAKQKLVATITANKANRFTKEALEAKSKEELEALAALAAPQTPVRTAPTGNNYVGAGTAPPSQFLPPQVQNTTPPQKMAMPRLAFDNPLAAKK